MLIIKVEKKRNKLIYKNVYKVFKFNFFFKRTFFNDIFYFFY